MRRVIAGVVSAAGAAILVIGAAVPAQAGVVLHKHTGNGTPSYDFGYGEVVALGSTWNDQASSISISSPAPWAILHEHEYYKGLQTPKFYVGTDNLGAYGYGFNDRASSIT